MLQVLYYIFFSITLFYGLYYLFTGLYGFFRPKQFRIRPCLPKNKFAIIIAARNEESVVGNLVTSLFESNYSSDLYEVFVAVNNTSDDTRSEERSVGKECRSRWS